MKNIIKNVIIVVLVVLIIVMGLVIYNSYVDKEITNNTSTNVDDNSSVEELGGEKLIQFDTKFYDLKEIAKEYKAFGNVNDTVDFNYDLDGDGIVDMVTCSDSTLKFDNQIISSFDNLREVYVVDFNETDQTLELVTYDWGPSGDDHYIIYSKKGNNLEKVYLKKGDMLKSDKKGLVVVGHSYSFNFNPSIYFDYVYIENSNVENKVIDLEIIKDIEISNSNWYFSTDYNNIDSIERLSENLTFKISNVEVVEGEYILHVTLYDGRVGYVFYPQLAG